MDSGEGNRAEWNRHNDEFGKLGARIAKLNLLPAAIATVKWIATVITAFAISEHLVGEGRISWGMILLMAGTIMIADYVGRTVDDGIQGVRQRQEMHRRKRDELG